MSIRIYNGYRFTTDVISLGSYYKRIQKLRECFKKENAIHFAKTVFPMIYEYQDMALCNPELFEKDQKERMGDHPAYWSNPENREEINGNVFNWLRSSHEDGWETLFAANIILFPKGLFLYEGAPNLKKVLLEQEDIREYAYTDQAEKPENISDAEWNQRKKDWEQVMDPDVVSLSELGFSISVANFNYLPYTIEELVSVSGIQYSDIGQSLKQRTKNMVKASLPNATELEKRERFVEYKMLLEQKEEPILKYFK